MKMYARGRFVALNIFLIALTASILGCGQSAQVKDAPAAPKVAPEGLTKLTDLTLKNATENSHYGVLVAASVSQTAAKVQQQNFQNALAGVGLQQTPVQIVQAKDARGTLVYAVIAGDYPDLGNAYYLQSAITRVVPGQYNLVLVPNQ